MPATRLLFIRHGETDWNVEGRLQGQRDIALNAKGRWQAAEAGRRALGLLKRHGLNAADLSFVASPLGRTRDTMERARLGMGLAPTPYGIDDRLLEFDFGDWEGMTWPEIKVRDPDRHKARKAAKWGFVPPGGESYAMLAGRVKPWLEEIVGDTVVVAHGGVARVLMVLVGAVSNLVAPAVEVHQGRVLLFQGDRFSWV